MSGNGKSEAGSSFIMIEGITNRHHQHTDMSFPNLLFIDSTGNGSILHKVVLEGKTTPS